MNPINFLRSLLRPRIETEETLSRRMDGLAGHRLVTTAPTVSVFAVPRRRALLPEGQPS